MSSNEIQRVVLLRKNLGERYSSEIQFLPRSATKWMALGHFDEMYTYDLPLESSNFFLHSIKQDKDAIARHNDDNVYYHPLYLVGKKQPLICSGGIIADEFRFIAIVRIHFAATRHQKSDFITLCSDIKDVCKQLSEKGTKISCNAYHATEFSDMVLDLRSQNFRVLQQLVLKTLRDNLLIGKMYTYFGINSDFLRRSDLCDQTDVINMLSVRFPCSADPSQIALIKNILSKNSKLDEPKNMFSVNGIDDTLISCHEVPTNLLLTVYRSIINTGNTPENVKSTTRIGFYIDTPLAKPEVTDIASLCDNLINLRKKLRDRLEEKNVIPRSWFHMIYEAINTLVRMSKTSVMDEIVYLLVPSLEAFIKNVIESDSDKINRHVKSYNEFAENQVSLIEQLMRLEGQLSQNPEFRPVICDIPVFVLEYTLAFLEKISKLLQYGDGGSKAYEFLMMPCSCPEIAVKELFPADKHLSGLVQLLIPDHELYTPELILRPLCHEIAHNVGETFRCRDVRKKYYCRAVATLVIVELLGTKSNIEAINILTERFKSKLANFRYPTILQMSSILRNDIISLTQKTDGKHDIADMNKFIHWYITTAKDPEPVTFFERYHLESIINQLFVRWSDIDTLFREIYADICLLRILDLPAEEYISSLINIDWRRQRNSIAYESYAVRIYVSLEVVGKDIPFFSTSVEGERVFELISQIQSEISHEHDGEYKLPYSINTIIDMLKYGKKCKQVMDEYLKTAEKDVLEVQKMYRALAYQNQYPGYDIIVESIDSYRKDLVNSNMHV